jgi:hypothetical protein
MKGRRQIVRAVLATLTALPVAAAIIAFGLGQEALNRADTATSIALNPLSPEAWSARAAELLAAGKRGDAARHAVKSVERSPLNPEAGEILGYVAETRGNPASATAFMAVAAAMGWGNETAQLWLIEAETRTLKFRPALLRTDALLRQRKRRDELFGFLRDLTLRDDTLAAMAGRLALRPKWRKDFLHRLAGLTPQGFDGHERLLLELAKTAAPPMPDEINPFLSRLVSEGFYPNAYLAWRRLARDRESGTLIGDGLFTRLNRPGTGSPFEWKILPTPGLTLQVESSSRIGNVRALHIAAEGRPSGPVLEQVLVLAPGTYLLSATWYATQRDSLQSLDWRLECLPTGSRLRMNDRATFAAADEWQLLERVVTIPPSGCGAQRLQLAVDHDESRDLDAWIHHVDLQRIN